LNKQLAGLAVGIVGFIAIQYIPIKMMAQFSPYCFFASLFLTALTLIPRITQQIHGSARWLKLPGVTFQPSELLKLTLILYLAHCIANQTKKYSFWHGYVPILSILIIPSLILLKQPDFGLTVTLFLTTLMLLFVAQFELSHVLITLLSLLPIAAGLIFMRAYRLKRVLTFLNPWQDPHGAGFQIIQSLIAIGSGGLTGVGIAHSRQKFFYLPMQHTDFIFSIIAEETGFIGCCLLVSLYVLFLYFGIKIALQLPNFFAKFTILGFVILTSLQTIINIAVATGLLPTKGIGLPFISYGKTALICNIWMIGIIIKLSKQD
jgi:cell division protein FtsW